MLTQFVNHINVGQYWVGILYVDHINESKVLMTCDNQKLEDCSIK